MRKEFSSWYSAAIIVYALAFRATISYSALMWQTCYGAAMAAACYLFNHPEKVNLSKGKIVVSAN